MENHKKSQFFDRIEILRTKANLTWDQLAEKLEVDRSYFFKAKAGSFKASPKVIYRLERLEIQFGLNTADQLELDRITAIGSAPVERLSTFLTNESEAGLIELKTKLTLMAPDDQDAVITIALTAANLMGRKRLSR